MSRIVFCMEIQSRHNILLTHALLNDHWISRWSLSISIDCGRSHNWHACKIYIDDSNLKSFGDYEQVSSSRGFLKAFVFNFAGFWEDGSLRCCHLEGRLRCDIYIFFLQRHQALTAGARGHMLIGLGRRRSQGITIFMVFENTFRQKYIEFSPKNWSGQVPLQVSFS